MFQRQQMQRRFNPSFLDFQMALVGVVFSVVFGLSPLLAKEIALTGARVNYSAVSMTGVNFSFPRALSLSRPSHRFLPLLKVSHPDNL